MDKNEEDKKIDSSFLIIKALDFIGYEVIEISNRDYAENINLPSRRHDITTIIIKKQI